MVQDNPQERGYTEFIHIDIPLFSYDPEVADPVWDLQKSHK